MHGVGVGGGVHGDGRDAQFLAGAQNAQRDLATVGYQDLVEHRCACVDECYSIITSGSPNSTGWPSSTRICVTVPARGDGIWFIVFIASMISKVCPAVTLAPTSMNGLAPGSDAQYTVPTIGEGTTPGCCARSMAGERP